MKNLYFFIGTEAELLKVMPIMQELSSRGVTYKLIFSGQNDINDSYILNILGIEKPDIVLYTGKISKSALGLFFWFIKVFVRGFKILRKEFSGLNKKETYLIVHGDTVSTFMGAVLGKLNGLKVAHTEAGYRSYNYLQPFPEELDRILTSFFSDVHFCPYEKLIKNVEKRKGDKVNTGYNTFIDSLTFALSQEVQNDFIKSLLGKPYFIFIMHRQENLFNEQLVRNMVDLLQEISEKMTCVFITHELTAVTLKKLNLFDTIKNNRHILVSPRIPYFEFIKLLDNSKFIMTDGGGNQQESYYLGKPCLILRNVTEGTEGIGSNVILSKNEFSVIKSFVNDYQKYKFPRIQPDNKPSKIIAEYLINH
jgi:UDP-N-acetylglucosamine 2-epimerase (non-hydrolysing)